MAAPTSVELQWDSLPCDLKELVLAHLSQAELWRLHSVCRAWLSTLTSSQFHRLHRRLHPRSHASLLVYNHPLRPISACEWRAGDVSAAAVQDVSAVQESSLSNASVLAPSWRNLSVPVTFVREWVGAHALVCVRNHLTSNGFSVGCPFSNRWKTLPNPPCPPLLSKLWAMVPHTSTKQTSTFSVLLLQLNSPSVYLDVYNSESNEWTQRALPLQSSITKVSFSGTPMCIGGLVYSVQAKSRSIVTYDVQRDLWKTLEAKLPTNLVFQVPKQVGLIQTVPQMMQSCKGKILMVGAAYMSGSGGNTGIAANDVIDYGVVWELDWSSKAWREIARAPSHMCMHMVEEAMESHKAALTPIKYSGCADLVIIMASGSQRALQFDVIEEKWAWLDLPSRVNCDLTLCLQPNSIEQF